MAENQRNISALAKASRRHPPPSNVAVFGGGISRDWAEARLGEDDRTWPLFGWDDDAAHRLNEQRMHKGAE